MEGAEECAQPQGPEGGLVQAVSRRPSWRHFVRAALGDEPTKGATTAAWTQSWAVSPPLCSLGAGGHTAGPT